MLFPALSKRLHKRGSGCLDTCCAPQLEKQCKPMTLQRVAKADDVPSACLRHAKVRVSHDLCRRACKSQVWMVTPNGDGWPGSEVRARWASSEGKISQDPPEDALHDYFHVPRRPLLHPPPCSTRLLRSCCVSTRKLISKGSARASLHGRSPRDRRCVLSVRTFRGSKSFRLGA